MDREQEIPTSLKIGLGIGIAYALYRLGLSLSTRAGGAPGGATTSAPEPSVATAQIPARTPGAPARILPTHPHDTRPVEIRVRPSPTDPRAAVIELTGRVLSIGDLIARIDAGGRRDVLVTVTGDTRTGAWEEIREALTFAGIQISARS
jgi:hypothetical protein